MPSNYLNKNNESVSKKDAATDVEEKDTYQRDAKIPSPKKKERNPKTRNRRYPPK